MTAQHTKEPILAVINPNDPNLRKFRFVGDNLIVDFERAAQIEYGDDINIIYIPLTEVLGMDAEIAQLRQDKAELLEAIERTAADRAYAAGLGASEWEAFLKPHEKAAIAKHGKES